MHTILSALLHPHFGSYLPRWVTRILPHPHYWHEYMYHSLFGQVLVPIAQSHQRVEARGSTTIACMCPHVQACQCSLCVMLLFVLIISKAKGCSSEGEKKRDAHAKLLHL